MCAETPANPHVCPHLNHLRPLRHFTQKNAKFLRRITHRFRTYRIKPCPRIRLTQRTRHISIQPRIDFTRRAGGREQAVPGFDVEAGQAFSDGWYSLRALPARGRGDARFLRITDYV